MQYGERDLLAGGDLITLVYKLDTQPAYISTLCSDCRLKKKRKKKSLCVAAWEQCNTYVLDGANKTTVPSGFLIFCDGRLINFFRMLRFSQRDC